MDSPTWGWRPRLFRLRPFGARHERILAGPCIEVGAEAAGVDGRCGPEDCHRCRRGHESMAPQWSELAHRHAVAGDDESLALIEPAHDFTAGVAELALRDGFSHASTVVRSATVVDSGPEGREGRTTARP